MSQYLVAPTTTLGRTHSELYAQEGVAIRDIVGRQTIRIEANPAAFAGLRDLESVDRIEPDAQDVQLLDPADPVEPAHASAGTVTDGGRDVDLVEVYRRETIQRCGDCGEVSIGDCTCAILGGGGA